MRARHHAGLTMIETMMSLILVGTLLVAAMAAVAASRSVMLVTSERGRGQQIALDLAGEILALAFRDPDDRYEFGPSPAEAGSGDRTGFDDVDDYLDWSATPPVDAGGKILDGLDESWSRTVLVEHASPFTLDPTGSETGVKRIIVRVHHHGRLVGEVTSLRAELEGEAP